MEAEQHHTDDQSHYEISLTAGQAFVAFVLLLLSLAASFAFGVMIGKGQADERLVVQKATPVVTEASIVPNKKGSGSGEIVELPVEDDDFADESATDTAAATETTATTAETTSDAVAPVITESAPAAETSAPAAQASTPAAQPSTPDAPKVPHYAQLLSTSDQKVAEGFAAKLIERGYSGAYVQRGAATEKGPVYRVRIKFPSEQEARAAEPKLREFSKEVWITTK